MKKYINLLFKNKQEKLNIQQVVDKHQVDFFDFGCSNGGSLIFGVQRLGGNRGLGIDIDLKKLEEVKKRGLLGLQYDIKDIPNKKMVEFTTMMDFLEHVPNLKDVYEFIEKACIVSRDFIFIRQPNFDYDGFLLEKKLKIFYSDWTGHPNHMSSLMLTNILRDMKNKALIESFKVGYSYAIPNSKDKQIHSIESPIDQFDYCKNTHPIKNENIEFENLFSKIVAIAYITKKQNAKIERLIHKTIYKSKL